ncbi:MAG TPA: VWA domain-containing protein [Candidatus Sulfotelmatobacter sp.]|nr:VWA domain-containing protein [Candidatus Sulfotelmatobacter sp.]
MILANAKQLLWLVLLVGLIFYDRRREKRRHDLLFSLELAPVMLRFWDRKMAGAKKILFYLALFFLIIALARPQWGRRNEILPVPGIDIVVAVDVSKSMLTKDLRPSRLENAKASLSLLADQLAGNRLALVAFAGSSYIECPLTPDVGAVKLFIASLDPNLIPVPGTDLGGALHTAVTAFGESANSKAIILLTDGEDLAGGARGAAGAAADKGIKIFPVGIGTALGEQVPEESKIVISKLDVDLLKELAEKTGGRAFFVGEGGSTLPELMGAIASLPKQRIKHDLTYEYTDRFQWFIFLALVCLLSEFSLSARRR